MVLLDVNMAFNELLWLVRSKVISKLNDDPAALKNNVILPIECFPPSCKLYLERFEEIIAEYGAISKFVDVTLGHVVLGDVEKTGSYVHAFCCGVSTILEKFSDVLKEIETTFLLDVNFSLVVIVNKLEIFAPALSHIKEAIEKITKKEFSGCTILNLCEHFINSGSPLIVSVFRQIECFCLKPFYLQTKLWMTMATLNDPYNEYFIKSEASSTSESSHQFTFDHGSFSSLDLYATSYALNPDNLPSIIPLSVASKILFIGESLIMCRHNEVQSEFKDQMLRVCGINEETVLNQFKEIETLDVFDLRKFTTLIDDVWIGLNRYIRKAANEIGNVDSQLFRLWEIYLLGRGELFQEFLTKGNHLLNADVTTIDSENLNIALRDAIYYVYLTENSDITEQFYFKLPPRKALKKGMSIWSLMRLNFKVKWPLHYLFSDEVVNIYNKLFCFLLRLKKAQIDLNATWKNTNKIRNRSLRMSVIEIRIQLLAIVGNLQNYCFTNVIANEMNSLMMSIQKIDLFTDLQKTLNLFLTNIMNRLFLSTFDSQQDNNCESEGYINAESSGAMCVNKKVNVCFLIIFKLCDTFSKLVEEDMNMSFEKFNELKKKFDNTLKKLISILHKIDENYYRDEDDSTAHLFNLIMCLDYNGFFREKLKIKSS